MKNFDSVIQACQKDLKSRARISWAYLLCVIGLLVAVFFFGYFAPIFMERWVFSPIFIFILIAIFSYFSNFYYGAFYFPRRYSRALEGGWLLNYDLKDRSNLRGISGAICTFLAFFFLYLDPEIRNQFKLSWGNDEWFMSFAWLALNAIIAWKSKTQGIFEIKTVRINEKMALAAPELLSWGDNWRGHLVQEGSTYGEISFLYPIFYNANPSFFDWQRRAVGAYIKWKQELYTKKLAEDDQLEESNRYADGLTYNAIADIFPQK